MHRLVNKDFASIYMISVHHRAPHIYSGLTQVKTCEQKQCPGVIHAEREEDEKYFRHKWYFIHHRRLKSHKWSCLYCQVERGLGKLALMGPIERTNPQINYIRSLHLPTEDRDRHSPGNVFFLAWNDGQCPPYYNTPLSESCRARVYKCSNCRGVISKF